MHLKIFRKEFLDLKVNWLIKNNKDDLVEKFLKKIMISKQKKNHSIFSRSKHIECNI